MLKSGCSFVVCELQYISCSWCKQNVLLQFAKLYSKYHSEALLFLVVERRWEYRAQHAVRSVINCVVRVKTFSTCSRQAGGMLIYVTHGLKRAQRNTGSDWHIKASFL
jgi:hypothetical protein